MGWDLSGLDCARVAVELAYFAVDERYRGQGIGAAIFYKSLLSVLGSLDGVGCSLFTIAKGVYAGTGKGRAVRDYLLEVERETNGVEGDRILVKGVKVPLKEIEDKFGLDHQNFRPRDESMATQVLAENWDWRRLGLSKNLSPVYGLTVFMS